MLCLYSSDGPLFINRKSEKTMSTSKEEKVNLNTSSQEKRPIFYQVTSEHPRLSLAYSDLQEVPQDVIMKFGHTIKELDLSHNRIADIRFLCDLPCIESLVLDDNHLTSQVKVPLCPQLHTLWVNDNRIQNLPTFLETLSRSCPRLRTLSMMNNQAAPSYFNGGTYEQYLHYRYFVISCLPELKYLDYSAVTSEERILSRKCFPTPKRRFFRRRKSNQRIQRTTGA